MVIIYAWAYGPEPARPCAGLYTGYVGARLGSRPLARLNRRMGENPARLRGILSPFHFVYYFLFTGLEHFDEARGKRTIASTRDRAMGKVPFWIKPTLRTVVGDAGSPRRINIKHE